ncbi:MAG TPA: hypothetical protein VI076_15620 [Actinopolymorphaceae bacterium]
MLGTALGGDSRTLHALAYWLTLASQKVHEVAVDLERAKRTVEESWTDDAGDLYAMKLDIGRRNALKLADAIDGLSALVVDCAVGLAEAQQRMSRAEEIATDGGLTLMDNRIVRPTWGDRPGGVAMPIYDQEQLEGLYDDPRVREWYEARLRAYDRAEAEVERACRIMDQLFERVTDRELPTSDMIFTLGDITAGGLELETARRWRSYSGSRDAALEWVRKWRGHGDATRRYSGRLRELLDMYDNLAADAKYEYGVDAARAARNGILRIVFKGSGPLVLTPGGILYDHYVEGDPWKKAIVKGAAGAAGGALVLGVIGFFGAPVTLGVVIVAGVMSYAASSASAAAYDHVEPARIKLAREFSSLDPGETNLDGRESKDSTG